MRENKSHVYLVGAGPGDPDLISVKGLKAIQKADVILYDALVNTSLLQEASDEAELIFVGKRNKQHTFSQEEINQLIVDKALTNKVVVRLKGGDPFIFGRGHEEINHIESFGIDYTIIPGISSSTGGATSIGLPLTRRGISDSFWVMTATTKEGQLSKDIHQAVESNATLVLLMGTKKIKEIQSVFMKAMKNDLPVAYVENATMNNERIIYTRVSHMYNSAQIHQVKAPALIIIGEVVATQKEFDSFRININHSSYVS